MAELKQFCKEEWANIHPRRFERLIASYRKCLIACCCCKGWHFQLLDLGGNTCFMYCQAGLDSFFFLIKIKSLFQNCILYVLGLSLCNILFFDDLNHSSVTNKQKMKKRKGAKTFSHHCILHIYIYIYIYIYISRDFFKTYNCQKMNGQIYVLLC